jgi:hypothetical protein|tara:strand:+ start:2600 stop:4213 length:1614 start_codon:yes stop_codon:yes gene_type:complete
MADYETDPRVNDLIDRFSRLKTHRSQWENHWNEIRQLVRVNTTDFNGGGTRGESHSDNIYDGTAPWALEQFSAGLHSHLTNPVDRWFNLELLAQDAAKDEESLLWLELASDIIYSEYSRPEATLNSSLHEVYLDIGGFGTAVLFQDYEISRRSLVFRSFPLADCFIQEDLNGLVDTLFRRVKMSGRQISQKFGDNLPEKIAKHKDIDKEWEVIHCVFPRADRNADKISKTNMQFASFWLSEECKYIFAESGYHEFPYHIPRWSKLAGEIYGRSPAMTCLPDIKMINQMSKVVIKGAQKIVDPPLMVPDDGFILPIRTAPSSLMFYQPGGDKIEPLITGGRIDIGLEMMNQRREHIIKSFFVDWILQQKNTTEMTATEVMDRREEKLRMMAPMIGRIEAELLGVMIQRSFGLLLRNGLLPPIPPLLQQVGLEISYSSPATRAQEAGKGAQIQKFMQDLVPLAEIAPDIMDVLDTDEFARAMSNIRDVSRKILRQPEDVAKMRAERAEQQQAQQQVEQGSQMSGSIKDLAQAEAMGGGG